MKTIDKKISYNKAVQALRAEDDGTVVVKASPDSPLGYTATDLDTLKDAFDKVGWPVNASAVDPVETVLVGRSEPDEDEPVTEPVTVPDPLGDAASKLGEATTPAADAEKQPDTPEAPKTDEDKPEGEAEKAEGADKPDEQANAGGKESLAAMALNSQ